MTFKRDPSRNCDRGGNRRIPGNPASLLHKPPTRRSKNTSGGVEEVVVTGSRIRREVADTPNPVTILDREELELTGMENVADILRHQTYNSFGSYRESDRAPASARSR